MAIKNIIFDFGGVIFDWDPRYLYKKIFNDDKKMEYFLTNITTPTWNAQMDAGKPFAQAIAELQAQHPEWLTEIGYYHTGWIYMLKGPIDAGVELLKNLKNKNKYKIYGLTNWSAETFPLVKTRYDFLNLFDGVLVSGQAKLIKPDPRIYDCLFKTFNLKPEECVFLDDSKKNVDASIKAGMHAIQVLDHQKVRAELEELLKEKI